MKLEKLFERNVDLFILFYIFILQDCIDGLISCFHFGLFLPSLLLILVIIAVHQTGLE